jgi:hypothetical protein
MRVTRRRPSWGEPCRKAVVFLQRVNASAGIFIRQKTLFFARAREAAALGMNCGRGAQEKAQEKSLKKEGKKKGRRAPPR